MAATCAALPIVRVMIAKPARALLAEWVALTLGHGGDDGDRAYVADRPGRKSATGPPYGCVQERSEGPEAEGEDGHRNPERVEAPRLFDNHGPSVIAPWCYSPGAR